MSALTLNDLLEKQGLDPAKVIVMRHRPFERELAKVLPWLAAEKPDVFNAYQQTQGLKLENSMKSIEGEGYVASFIGLEAGMALFIGIYKISSSRPMTLEQFWQVPAFQEMKGFGMRGFTAEEGRETILWFDLDLTDLYAEWKGKLIIDWPPPERSWWRRSHKNQMGVRAIHDESLLDADMPDWDKINLTWDELAILPIKWRQALSQWRGIYFIFDESDGKGYIGSAYGSGNLLGRWVNYAATGHGGNKQLRKRNPQNFRFTILQRVSPDLGMDEVIRLEASWKDRLHTRGEFGLNDN
ncbi:MAG: GIY-YIG nuclease family protein [Alphaproteobacteria bacterium]|nr:GIY-YIG nuclease family protein [Alphaproteobacteria bacterium]